MLDLTMLAFDLSFEYRNPVVLLCDGYLGQMTGKVVLPRDMVKPGLPGVGGLGRPGAPAATSSPRSSSSEADLEAHNVHARRQVRAHDRPGAAGRSLPLRGRRRRRRGLQHARADGQGRGARSCGGTGVRAGLFRPLTLWPFPIRALEPLLRRASRLVVVEASSGQLEDELRLALSHAGLEGRVAIDHVRHSGGVLPQQSEIVAACRAEPPAYHAGVRR